MRILIALDAFKDGCTSIEACNAVVRGISTVSSNQEVIICPMSDGGEGTVDVLHYHCGGTMIEAEVSDALFRKRPCRWLKLDDGRAIIEMAQCAGLELLADHERNPLNTSTFGVGELIYDAISHNCSQIFVTLGGSATNDLGMGLASALGWQFLNKGGKALAPIGANMSKVSKIVRGTSDYSAKVVGWTDVENPLLGSNGAAHVYASQKGASIDQIEKLEVGAQNLVERWKKLLPKLNVENVKGSGAAGGLGAGIAWCFNGTLRSGFDQIAEMIRLPDLIRNCDIIITGEGSLDSQSIQGKLVGQLSKMAEKNHKSIYAFVGMMNLFKNDTPARIRAVYQINEGKEYASLQCKLRDTLVNLEESARRWAQDHLTS